LSVNWSSWYKFTRNSTHSLVESGAAMAHSADSKMPLMLSKDKPLFTASSAGNNMQH